MGSGVSVGSGDLKGIGLSDNDAYSIPFTSARAFDQDREIHE